MSAVLLQLSHRTLVLAVFESALILGDVATAASARLGTNEGLAALGTFSGIAKVTFAAIVCQLCLYYADLYDAQIITDRRETFVRVLQSLAATSMILAVIYFWFPTVVIGRSVFMIAAVLVIVTAISSRVAFQWLMWRLGPRERLLLIGTTDASVTLARELHNKRVQLGVEIVGFVDADPIKVGQPLINPGIIGTLEDIPAIVRTRTIDRVVVGLTDARGKLPMEKLLDMRVSGITFDHLASVYERYTGKIAVESLRPSWFIFSSGFRHTRALVTVKRLLDIAAAVTGLLLTAPFMLLVAAAVKLTSRGPIFYTQKRVGQNGRIFMMRKFRSMRQDAESESGAVWATANDTRLTPIGCLLRSTRADELPQLWNVVIGDMSMVGPRPERPEFVCDLERRIQFYGQRHAVKPGLTGWAQICYSYGSTVDDALQKLQYDLYYLKHMSIALDLFIILSTLKTILSRRGY
jgi:sugar transferase (PEP-CTERM system associated)